MNLKARIVNKISQFFLPLKSRQQSRVIKIPSPNLQHLIIIHLFHVICHFFLRKLSYEKHSHVRRVSTALKKIFVGEKTLLLGKTFYCLFFLFAKKIWYEWMRHESNYWTESNLKWNLMKTIGRKSLADKNWEWRKKSNNLIRQSIFFVNLLSPLMTDIVN